MTAVGEHLGTALASAQRRLWFLHQLGGPAYTICTAIEMTGPLSVPCLRTAVARLGRRHDVLRATFDVVDDEPRQWFHSPPPALCVVDLTGLAEQAEAELDRRLRGLAGRVFDLAEAPPVSWTLFRLASDEHVLALTVHHIVFDGGSLAVVRDELAAAYRACRAGRPDGLPSGPGFADVVALEVADPAGLEFWRAALRDAPARTSVFGSTVDGPATAVSVADQLTPSTWRAAGELARREGVTPYMVLFAAVACLVARYSGQRDVVLGSPVDLRGYELVSGVVGMLTNTLPLRVRLAGDPSFREVLARVRDALLDALDHQLTPFEEIVDALGADRDAGVSPVFQVLFAYQQRPELPELPGLSGRIVPVPPVAAKYELTVTATAHSGGLDLSLESDAGCCAEPELRAFARRCSTLLDAAVRNPEIALSRLPLVSSVDTEELLRCTVAGRGDADPGPVSKSMFAIAGPELVHRLVERRAAEQPDAVAVVCGAEHLTYHALNGRANRLARELRLLGAGPDVVVAVRLPRTADLVVAVLAVLKSGAAYLPVDLAAPVERVRVMLADAGARLAVTSFPDDLGLPAVSVDPAGHLSTDLGLPIHPRSLAYVLSTSGSTGTPKGVAIEHGSAAAFLRWVAEAFTAEELSAVLATTSIGFDLSVFELFGPLTTGGAVVLVESALHVAGQPAAARATLLNTVPSAAAALLDADGLPTGLRAVNLAGEPLPGDLVRGVLGRLPGVVVRNLYGPSEATTYATVARVDGVREPTIGAAIDPAAVWVAGETGTPLPSGVVGELVIGGPTVARGYLRRPRLTAESFVPDPYQPGRLYRTGDLARRRGDLVFLGRVDDQIKIRGVRIELGEVEAALRAVPGVKAAAVVPTGRTAADRALVGFVTGPAAQPDEALTALRSRLPSVMVPSHVVVLESLPLNENGKTDRAALVRLAATPPARPHALVAPRTDVERLIAEAWREVLGLERVGVHDGFFEAGGTSLALLRLQRAVARRVQPAPRLVDLFRFPTVAALAGFLSRAGQDDGVARAQARGARRRTALAAAEVSR